MRTAFGAFWRGRRARSVSTSGIVFDDVDIASCSLTTHDDVPTSLWIGCQACDCWSIGVITYMLLAGMPPFFAPTDDGIKLKIKWSRVSGIPREG